MDNKSKRFLPESLRAWLILVLSHTGIFFGKDFRHSPLVYRDLKRDQFIVEHNIYSTFETIFTRCFGIRE